MAARASSRLRVGRIETPSTVCRQVRTLPRESYPYWRARHALQRSGESIEDVSRFLDHSSLAVTTTYLRRLEGQEDKSWEKVAAAIGIWGSYWKILLGRIRRTTHDASGEDIECDIRP